MSYYLSRTIFASFPDPVDRIKAALKSHEFGVLTDIGIRRTLKEKIGAEFCDYRILGACSPALAYRALTSEYKIGTMLPCNIIVQDLRDGRIEVAAIDPRAAMGRIDNPELERIAEEVATKLTSVIAAV